ncbi:MAG: hypothetical protein V3U84_03990 [Thiotrichaceae bacterium]
MREARKAEWDRQETYVAILGNSSYGKKGETIQHLKNRIFGHEVEIPDVKMDDETRKSMEAQQPEWLRKNIEAGRKKNLEAWDKIDGNISTETTDP